MKQITPKKVKIGEVEFYITPFPAFYASNLSGELSTVVVPVLTGLLPILSAGGEDGEVKLSELKVDEIAPSLASALGNLDGNKVENLMRKLLIDKGNIACCYTDENGDEVKEKLTYDLTNEIFCQDILDMYKLAWEVIDLNFGSFFGKASNLFGNQKETIKMKKK